MASNHPILPPAHVGTSAHPDWIKPEEVYPRAFIGQPAPYFEGEAYFENDFKKVSLDDYKGKYFVFFWYPLDFTFVCPTEIIAYTDAAPQFEENNCAILGASVDSKFSHFEYCQKPRNQGGLGELKAPLLSDFTKVISRIYGALITAGPDAGVACRATFIIDPKGILRHASYSDLPVGRNIEETLRLVQAFQYSDIHGEVCPAKWKKGAPTLKPTIEKTANTKYWEEEHAKK